MKDFYCTEALFQVIYSRYYDKLVYYLRSKCGCMLESEDLAQDAFYKLWKNREKIEEGKEQSYLFTIANNLFIDRTRRDKVKRNYQSTITYLDDSMHPEYIMRMKEHEHFVFQTIKSIPEKSREVFIMNRLKDMTYSEIAENLNLSVKAIEKRMAKALHVFRDIQLKTAI